MPRHYASVADFFDDATPCRQHTCAVYYAADATPLLILRLTLDISITPPERYFLDILLTPPFYASCRTSAAACFHDEIRRYFFFATPLRRFSFDVA